MVVFNLAIFATLIMIVTVFKYLRRRRDVPVGVPLGLPTESGVARVTEV